jgi:hypothetical protein
LGFNLFAAQRPDLFNPFHDALQNLQNFNNQPGANLLSQPSDPFSQTAFSNPAA